MKITDMINEWYKGCSCCDGNPINCNECTQALITAIDSKAFINETMEHCAKIAKDNTGFAGIAVAASYSAQAIAQRRLFIEARNEHTNKKD